MSDSAIQQILGLVRSIDQRLTKLEVGGGTGSSGSTAAGGRNAELWGDFVTEFLEPLKAATAALGDDKVTAIVQVFSDATLYVGKLLAVADSFGAPSDADLREILVRLGGIGRSAGPIKQSAARTDSQLPVFAVAEAMGVFMWVQLKKGITSFIRDTAGSSQFHTNKMLRAARDKGDAGKPAQAWVAALNKYFTELSSLVTEHFATGIPWKHGAPACKPEAVVIAGTAPSAKPAAKPAAKLAAKVTPAGAAADGLGSSRTSMFAELSKGADVTKGLRQVRAEDKTKHRPAEQRVGIVRAKPRPGPKRSISVEERLGLEGAIYVVEGQFMEKITLPADDLNKRIMVRIYGCERTVVSLPEGSKISQIIVDRCKNVSVVCDQVVVSVQVVNSSSTKLQVLGKVPTVSIEGCSGAQLYLGAECVGEAATTIISSRSSEMNVNWLKPAAGGSDEPGDWVEFPIPEQFRSIVRDGGLVTEMSEHAG